LQIRHHQDKSRAKERHRLSEDVPAMDAFRESGQTGANGDGSRKLINGFFINSALGADLHPETPPSTGRRQIRGRNACFRSAAFSEVDNF